MVQVKDISDEEVLEVVKNYWAGVKLEARLQVVGYVYPISILDTLSSKYPEKVVLRRSLIKKPLAGK